MATAEQLKSLIRSHFSDEPERFFTIVLQVAAHEAQKGHGELAHEIRKLVDKARKQKGARIIKFPQDLKGLVLSEEPELSKSALVVPLILFARIERIIQEYKQQHKLRKHGLINRRKIMLIGPPGTGKTMTALILAHELHLPLNIVQIDQLVTKYMGETSAKLRQIFSLLQRDIGVYLFDEFDAIGGERSLDNDVGEMRRVLNSFLQFIEQDTSGSVIIAATNNPKLLDRALFRRFDDVLYYEKPDLGECKRLIQNILRSFKPSKFPWKAITSECIGLSHAEIDQACMDSIKQAILSDKRKVNAALLRQMLQERQNAHSGRKE
ncbi:MAG: ATP-binding protein [Candidatus Aegiribacteria sp.]|nr:ATP-binding protein [Candidatus Aegiribacteria sp.]